MTASVRGYLSTPAVLANTEAVPAFDTHGGQGVLPKFSVGIEDQLTVPEQVEQAPATNEWREALSLGSLARERELEHLFLDIAGLGHSVKFETSWGHQLFLLILYAPCLSHVADAIQTRSIDDAPDATETRSGRRLKSAAAGLVVAST